MIVSREIHIVLLAATACVVTQKPSPANIAMMLHLRICQQHLPGGAGGF
jgi:hypothetical protein